jgi:phosphatidylglycerophosphatase A
MRPGKAPNETHPSCQRMNTKTDASRPVQAAPSGASPAPPRREPRLALFFATACGLGYLPKAPGTWGSLVGALVFSLIEFYGPLDRSPDIYPGVREGAIWASWTQLPMAVVIAAVGVWASNRAAGSGGRKDPQFVVIDEVSGQHLSYLLALAPVDWKYMLLGLILFRVFDIWKPFPARRAESLPGGWGIMADDWIAGIYAAMGLWIARAFGL